MVVESARKCKGLPVSPKKSTLNKRTEDIAMSIPCLGNLRCLTFNVLEDDNKIYHLM